MPLLFPDLQKDYAFGYDVNEVDEYGNPNVHSRTEVREGPHVKGGYYKILGLLLGLNRVNKNATHSKFPSIFYNFGREENP